MKMVLADSSAIGGWRKSSRCDNSGPNCVEVAKHDGTVAVRNSTDPAGPAVLFTPAEMSAFVAGVKDGEFDDFLE